jgi:hypothetical protein
VRSIPDPGFPDDDGSAPPEVVAALAAYGREPDSSPVATLAVLQHARLLVPVVAVAGEVELDDTGLAHDKTSDMAAVLMRGRDGRTALLAFTGRDSMRRWDPEARPVPVTTMTAARAARQDGADALLVDVAGPSSLVVSGEHLELLATGSRLVEVSDGYAWVRPDR